MNTAVALMLVYILVTVVLQLVGFGVSRGVDAMSSSWSLMTFLIWFMGAFGFAWPIAVYITEWLIPTSEEEKQAARAVEYGVTRSR
jgi:hypothetical protein